MRIRHVLLDADGGVHLATNQVPYRAAYMRDVLGYDALFDVSCYSCDLGVAKPAPADALANILASHGVITDSATLLLLVRDSSWAEQLKRPSTVA